MGLRGGEPRLQTLQPGEDLGTPYTMPVPRSCERCPGAEAGTPADPLEWTEMRGQENVILIRPLTVRTFGTMTLHLVRIIQDTRSRMRADNSCASVSIYIRTRF